jgi:hypothetical protein
MIRRPAVTLIEVLISMFIMAIGMLALLVLFPLGAVSMGQALKDDRCASTASMAENVAIAMNVRHDSSVTTAFAGQPGLTLLYVDPYGAIQALPNLGGVIPRVSTSFVASAIVPIYAADRWFSLPDDIGFLEDGTPDTSSGFIDRGRRYSYAYLLKQLSPNMIQLYVVVYSGRPVNTLTAEPTYTAVGTAGTNSIVVSPTGTNPWPPTIKRGGWVLDPVAGVFYRVTNYAEAGGNTTVDIETNLVANVSQIIIMDYVAEVFDKGASWQP